MTILAAIREARDVLVKRAVTDEDWALVARTDAAIKQLESLIVDARRPSVLPSDNWTHFGGCK